MNEEYFSAWLMGKGGGDERRCVFLKVLLAGSLTLTAGTFF